MPRSLPSPSVEPLRTASLSLHRDEISHSLKPSLTDSEQGFVKAYSAILAAAADPANPCAPFRTILEHLASPETPPAPLLVHCTAGKDSKYRSLTLHLNSGSREKGQGKKSRNRRKLCVGQQPASFSPADALFFLVSTPLASPLFLPTPKPSLSHTLLPCASFPNKKSNTNSQKKIKNKNKNKNNNH